MNRIEKWTKSWLDTKKKKRIFGAKIEKSKEKKKSKKFEFSRQNNF